jgi:hypothetical protein
MQYIIVARTEVLLDMTHHQPSLKCYGGDGGSGSSSGSGIIPDAIINFLLTGDTVMILTEVDRETSVPNTLECNEHELNICVKE